MQLQEDEPKARIHQISYFLLRLPVDPQGWCQGQGTHYITVHLPTSATVNPLMTEAVWVGLRGSDAGQLSYKPLLSRCPLSFCKLS